MPVAPAAPAPGVASFRMNCDPPAAVPEVPAVPVAEDGLCVRHPVKVTCCGPLSWLGVCAVLGGACAATPTASAAENTVAKNI